MTAAAWLAGFEQHLRDDLDRADATIEQYRWILSRADVELPEGLLRSCADELKAWINAANKRTGARRSKSCRALYGTAFRSFFRYACDPTLHETPVDFNPTGPVPVVSVPAGAPRPLRDAQVDDILGRADDPYRLWMLLACYAGLRCTEVAQLHRGDVDPETMLVHGKGDKDRVVPTHEYVWQAVSALPAGPVAVNGRGAGTTRQEVSRRANRHILQLGHPDVTLHRGRHWYATRAYEANGGDIMAVKKLLGHSSVATTQRYVGASDESMRASVTGLPALTRRPTFGELGEAA